MRLAFRRLGLQQRRGIFRWRLSRRLSSLADPLVRNPLAMAIGNAKAAASIFNASIFEAPIFEESLMPARPLSPHLTVYRFSLTMALSILHRITGVLLTLGLLLLGWWLLSVANGPQTYETARQFMSGWFVKLLLAVWLAAFVYHLCTGIRHLIWDLALSMEKPEARQSGPAVIIAALLLFLILGYLAFIRHGGAS